MHSGAMAGAGRINNVVLAGLTAATEPAASFAPLVTISPTGRLASVGYRWRLVDRYGRTNAGTDKIVG
jgi:hypothetical protein